MAENNNSTYPTGRNCNFPEPNTQTVTNLLLNFMGRFEHSFFYSFFFQIILIFYMHKRVGHGKYWNFLLIASIFGILAACCENFTVAFEDTYGNCSNITNKVYIIWFIQEIFWIPTEYAIPYLNLIKLNAVTQKFVAKCLKVIVGIVLFIAFIVFRAMIGYNRFHYRLLNDDITSNGKITMYHGYAFGIMAIADILCTIFIIYELYSTVQLAKLKGEEEISVSSYIMKSSYAILLLIDVCSAILAILSLVIKEEQAKKSIMPFQALKSNFILILAIDTLIMKIDTNKITGSSNTNTKKSTSQLRNKSNNTTFGSSGMYSNIASKESSNATKFEKPSYHSNTYASIMSPKLSNEYSPVFSTMYQYNNNGSGGGGDEKDTSMTKLNDQNGYYYNKDNQALSTNKDLSSFNIHNSGGKKNQISNIVLEGGIDMETNKSRGGGYNNRYEQENYNSAQLLAKNKKSNQSVNPKSFQRTNDNYTINNIMKSPNVQYDGLNNRVSMQYYSKPEKMSYNATRKIQNMQNIDE